MFKEKIPRLQNNEKLFRMQTDTRYARLNWTHHLKPLAKESYLEFIKHLDGKGYSEKPYFNCLSDSVAAGEEIKTPKDIYGDSISVQYGHTPVRSRPLVTHTGGLKVLVEDGASLVFSMGINGAVLAFIQPQKTEISKTKQKYYLIGEWRNAAEISKSDIRKMLEFLFEIQTYCGILYSGKHSAWILTKLSAKDASIRGGTNPLMRYVKYFTHLVNGVRKLYGMGSPAT